MITQEMINTKVGAACARLGHPIANAHFWQTTGLAEQAILDEIAVMEAEEAASQVVNPLEALKQHLRNYKFDEFAMLALKDKRDRAETPIQIVEDVYTWQAAQIAKAVNGQTNFDAPPHTFTEALTAQ